LRLNVKAPEMKPLLTRYWFNVYDQWGFGVTAYSIEDVLSILADEGVSREQVTEIVENVDVGTLDQGHVAPNMGPPNFRGLWFPCLNIGWRHTPETDGRGL
jgi:hypothetical protein